MVGYSTEHLCIMGEKMQEHEYGDLFCICKKYCRSELAQ